MPEPKYIKNGVANKTTRRQITKKLELNLYLRIKEAMKMISAAREWRNSRIKIAEKNIAILLICPLVTENVIIEKIANIDEKLR